MKEIVQKINILIKESRKYNEYESKIVKLHSQRRMSQIGR